MNMMKIKALGSRIRDGRKRLGATQQEFAILCGLKREHDIRRFENDRNVPSPTTLLAIARALDTTVEYLLTGETSVAVTSISES